MYKLTVYVPVSHLEKVKQALFAAGAGAYPGYDCCCWQVLGQGQFRPAAGSRPFIGSEGRVELVDEYRVEMLCRPDLAPAVVKALRRAHPYEEPAFDFCRLQPVAEPPDNAGFVLGQAATAIDLALRFRQWGGATGPSAPDSAYPQT